MAEPAAALFEQCIAAGGVALFGADTVYGLACSPEDPAAVERLYRLKGRAPDKAAAVMFFDLEAAFAALSWLGERTREALGRLLPGGVTVLLPNPAGAFPLACAGDPTTLGLRVVAVPALAGVRIPVLQSSANLAGRPDPRRLDDVHAAILGAVDLVLDGGELPGVPSTVVDLRSYEQRAGAEWTVLREGAVGRDALALALDGQFHFDPATYDELIRADIPVYDELQDELMDACSTASRRAGGPRRILELGTGTGETAGRLLERFTEAALLGIDVSAAMLRRAATRLPAARIELRVASLQDPLPAGPFDLVASALCVHHLSQSEKQSLFRRVREALRPGGRFVLADVVVPVDPADAVAELTSGYDKPDTAADQLRWLVEAGFRARLCWSWRDLAVIAADAPG